MTTFVNKQIETFFFDIENSQEFTIETRGWDLPNPVDITATRFRLSELGFTLVTGDINLPLTNANYDHNRQMLAGIASEIISKSTPIISQFLNNNTRFDNVLLQGGLTPDLVFFGASFETPSVIYEFKSSLSTYTEDMVKELRRALEIKYGTKFPRVRVIFTTLNARFLRSFKAGPFITNFFSFILNQFRQSNIRKPTKREMLSDWSRPFDHLFSQVEKMGINYGKEAQTKNIKDYDEKTFKEDILDLIEKGIPFFDDNWLPQGLAAREMFSFLKERKPNIWSKKHVDEAGNLKSDIRDFWNRDKNREKTSKVREDVTTHGHRSTFLTDFLIHKDMPIGKDVTQEHVNTLIDEINNISIPEDEESVFSSTVFLARKVFKNFFNNIDTLSEIRKVQKEIAFKLTEQKKDALQPLTKRDIDLEIKLLVDDIMKKQLNAKIEDPSVRISKQGYIRFTMRSEDRYYTGINRKVDKFLKEEVDHLDMDRIDFDFDKLFAQFKDGPGYNQELKDFYIPATSINKHANTLLNTTERRLHELMSSKTFGHMYWTQKFYRGYMAQFPKLASKKIQNSDFGFYGVDGVPIYVIASPPPSEITTGAIITFTFLKKEAIIPPGVQEGWEIDIPNSELKVYMTKPFRINLKFMERYEELMMSWLSLSLFAMNYDLNIHTNNFFNSFFLRYTRQLNQVLDASYLLMKNSINYGSVGKKEYPKKFAELQVRDVRVGKLVKNLLDNYSTFSDNMRKYNEVALKEKFNIKDPIFGFQHKSLQTFLLIVYLRQIYLKNDGYDENFVGFDFFKAEWEHQEEYRKSPFNENNLPPFTDLSMKEFMDKAFISDTEIEKVTFHLRTCKFLIKQLLKEASTKNKSILGADNFKDLPADETSVNSRVNMYDFLLPNDFKKEVKEKTLGVGSAGKYKGIQSIPLPEALQIEILNFREFAIKHLNVNPESINNYKPTLSDLLIYELQTYPNHAVLTIKVKEQKGYAKRIFFIQTIDNRNLNKLMDESLNNLLENVEEDMIVIPGDFKLADLEKKMRDLGFDFAKGFILTGDQTKFGDKYPLQTFDVMIDTLWEEGYYSKSQRDLFREAINRLKGRVTLAPPNSDQLLQKLNKAMKETGAELSQLINDGSQKVISKGALLRLMTSRVDVWESFLNNPAWFNIVMENLAISKFLGFVLGVFNKLGSTYTAAQLKAMDIVLSECGLKGVIKGAAHSDDIIKFVAILSIKKIDLDKVDIRELLKMLRSGWLLNNNPGTRVVSIFPPPDLRAKGMQPFTISADVIVKFVAIMDLMLPRLVGQAPSLTKTGYGPSGEVLQVPVIGGKAIPPIMRYANSMGADLPGKSPSIDLSSALGRVYNVLVNGGTMQLVNDLEILANWFVWQRYGIEPEQMSNINRKVPELGGYNYFFPPLLIEQGFAANEMRLWARATAGDTYVRNQIILMMDTDFVFKQKEIFEVDTEVDTTALENTETEINISSESFAGVVSTRKVFEINYTRNLKTLNSFFALYKRNEELIESEAKRYLEAGLLRLDQFNDFNNQTRFALKVKSLKSALAPRILAQINGPLESLATFLGRYLTKSFQESYLRIPLGTMVINRLGFLDRLFANPFSEKFKAKGPEFRKERYTVNEIWTLVLDLAFSGDFESRSDNEIFFRELKGLWVDNINQVNNFDLEFKITESIPFRDPDLDLKWEKLEPQLTAPIINVNPSLVIAIVMQMRRDKKPFDQLNIVLAKPWLLNNQHVRSAIQTFINFIDGLNFGEKEIQRHVNVLTKIFQPRGILTVARIPEKDGTPLSRLIFGNFAFGRNREGILSFPKSIYNATREDLSLTPEEQAKILSVAATLATIKKVPLEQVSAKKDGGILNLQKLATSLQRLVTEEFTLAIGTYNAWLASNIFQAVNDEKAHVIFYRPTKSTDEKKRFFGIHVGDDWFYYKIIGKSLSDEKDLYEGFTTNSDPKTTAFFFFLTSFFLQPKKARLESLEQFKEDPKRTGNFTVKNRSVMNFSERGFNLIHVVQPSQATTDLANIPKSKFKDLAYEVEIPRKEFFLDKAGNLRRNNKPARKYIISVWKVIRKPSNVLFNAGGQDFEDSTNKIVSAEPAKFNSMAFLQSNESVVGFNFSDELGQLNKFRRLLIAYNVIKRTLLLPFIDIPIDSTVLTTKQYLDFAKFMFYSGINGDSLNSIRKEFEEIELNTIMQENWQQIENDLDIIDENRPLLSLTQNEFNMSRLIMRESITLRRQYSNSLEILVMFIIQRIFLGKSPEDFTLKIFKWFDGIQAADVLEILHRDNILNFTAKWIGFNWGTPRPMSSSYFVNIMNMLKPEWADLNRGATTPDFTLYWHGNAAPFLEDLLFSDDGALRGLRFSDLIVFKNIL